MRKKIVWIMLGAMLFSQTAAAAERIEKEPIKVASENTDTPKLEEEQEEAGAEASEDAEASQTASSQETESSQKKQEAAASEEGDGVRDARRDKWKSAVREAGSSTKAMKETVVYPEDGRQWTGYQTKGRFGFYYDADKYEVTAGADGRDVVLHKKGKGAEDQTVEMEIQYLEGETSSSLAEWYVKKFKEEGESASESHEEAWEEASGEDEKDGETEVVVDGKSYIAKSQDAEGKADSGTVGVYITGEEEPPSLGTALVGDYDYPSMAILGNGMEQYEEHYVLPVEGGCLNISLIASITQYEELEELYKILNSMIIDQVAWEDEDAMELANESSVKLEGEEVSEEEN